MSIIKVLIVSVLVGILSFPSFLSAENVDEAQRFIPNRAYDEVINEIPRISNADAADAALNAVENGQEAAGGAVVQLGQQWFVSSLKSFIAGFVLIGATEVHKRAHDRNLQLTPDAIRNLTKEVIGEWSIFKQSLYGTGDATLMFIPSQGLNFISSKTISRLVQSPAMADVLSSFISGTALSIGLNYMTEMITVASEYVIEHPDRFNGLSSKELNVLKLLRWRAGVTYYFYGLIHGGPATKSAYLKTFRALQMILLSDPVLRETLWAHMTREALLKGSNATVIGLSVVSTLVRTTFFNSARQGTGLWGANWKSFTATTLLAVAVTEFLPNWIEDAETYAMRAAYADVNGWTSEQKTDELTAYLARTGDQTARSRALEKYLAKIRKSREKRVVMFVSLMKLALDRIENLEREKSQVVKLHEEKVERQKLEPWVQRMEDIPANVFFSALGGDLLPYNWRWKEDDKLVYYYKQLFIKSAAQIQTVYNSSAGALDGVIQKLNGTDERARLALETQNLDALRDFMRYFADDLKTSWTQNPSANYWQSRQALDQLSFWGVREADLLKLNP